MMSMTSTTFITFLIAAIVLAVTPGPSIAYVIARTVSGGRAVGLASCLGTGLGGLLHVAAAALGLSVLVAQSALAFSIVKYAGAAYLIYLGVRMLMRKDAATSLTEAPAQVAQSEKSAKSALLEGIAVEALNVKTALFFLAFLPQFVTPAEPLAAQLVMLGSICVVLNTGVDVVVVFAATRLLASETARAARAKLMNRVSGVTMLGLGAYLALARREV